jgi:predicted metal-dependent enzyme (double-stranded beta helix superfamily)
LSDALARCVRGFEAMLGSGAGETEILDNGRRLVADLIARDDWLPESHARPDPARYRQYLLHRDADARFSIVSFVWGPGQATPIHDHTVWGLVGVLRGAEISERFAETESGLHWLATDRLEAGEVDAVSPSIGDIHRVANAHADRVSISIHVYGADIGAIERHVFDAAGNTKPFISGYADLEPA